MSTSGAASKIIWFTILHNLSVLKCKIARGVQLDQLTHYVGPELKHLLLRAGTKAGWLSLATSPLQWHIGYKKTTVKLTFFVSNTRWLYSILMKHSTLHKKHICIYRGDGHHCFSYCIRTMNISFLHSLPNRPTGRAPVHIVHRRVGSQQSGDFLHLSIKLVTDARKIRAIPEIDVKKSQINLHDFNKSQM